MNLLIRIVMALLIAGSVFTAPAKTIDVKKVMVLEVNGAIGPAYSDYIKTNLSIKQTSSYQLALIKLNTPGGLLTATRDIIQSITSSTIPVIVYVSPSGARAASAGTFITYAANVAVMAPGTNIGAATPISMGASQSKKDDKADNEDDQDQKTLKDKTLNDSVALIRSLAQMHNRNADWAEKAVAKAESITAKQAKKLGVINFIANNDNALINKLDNYQLNFNDKMLTLKTDQAELVQIEPTFSQWLLAILTSPTLAYILLLIGIYGLIFEVMNPGLIVPGVVGAISLLLGVYGLHMLPVNFVGIALLFAGVALMLIEMFVTSFGILAIGGIISFFFGSVMLYEPGTPGVEVAVSSAVGITIFSAVFFLVIIRMAIRSQRRKKVFNAKSYFSQPGIVVETDGQTGRARFAGEIWKIANINDDVLKKDQTVYPVTREGLIIKVQSQPPKE